MGVSASDALRLEPILTQDDDLDGFGRPWNPELVVFAVFFAAELAGGLLVALNFRRLGMPRRFLPTLALFGALCLCFWGGLLLLASWGSARRSVEAPASVQQPSKPPVDIIVTGGGQPQRAVGGSLATSGRWVRIVRRILAVFLAFWVTRAQKRRFRLFSMGDGRPGALLPIGLLALLADWLFQLFLFRCLFPLLLP